MVGTTQTLIGNPEKFERMGSLYFNGVSSVFYIGQQNFAFGRSDFTVEWFQNVSASQDPSIIFSLGSAPATLSAQINQGSLEVYFNGVQVFAETLNDYQDQWHHIAISRKVGYFRVFVDGQQLGTSIYNISNLSLVTKGLTLGAQTVGIVPNSFFNGYITNFHWVKGFSLYDAAFTAPAQLLSVISQTKLLLRVVNSKTRLKDSSQFNYTPTNHGVTFQSLSPFA